MNKYEEVDLSFYAEGVEGDIVIEDGDFQLTDPYHSTRQDITNRIRTQTGDWRHHPKIGGDLELLEGEPNTRETANRGVQQILQTLTYDGRFQASDIEVRAIPSSLYQVDYYVFLNAGKEPIIVKEQQHL